MNESDKKLNGYPAHLGWRLLALLYDGVVGIALAMLASSLVLLVHNGIPVQTGSVAGVLALLFFWLVFGAYAVISWRFGGQTMGMRPWRLKVLNAQGLPACWETLCLRYAIASLSLGSSLLWALIDAEKRGAHDIATGTWFVRVQALKSA